MTLRRRVLGWTLAGFLSSAAFQACGGSSADKDGGAGNGTSGTGGSTQSDGMVVDAPPAGGAGGESPYDPLCGVTDESCIPDSVMGERSCTPVTAGRSGAGGSSGAQATGGRSGAGTGGTAQAGSSTSGGTAGESGGGGRADAGEAGMSVGGEGGRGEAGAGPASAGAPSDGGAPPAPGDFGGESSGGQSAASGEGGGGQTAASGEAGAPSGTSGKSAGAGGGGAAPTPRSCQVELRDGEPRAVCAPSGQGTTSSVCFSSADCAAGLACIGDTSPGQCRPYCCTGAAACGENGTHCSAQHLAGSERELLVPVCMPATGCNLADEYPCDDQRACSCPADKACVVVTDDGKTSCVPATSLGEGEAGQACPCAHGHVCSKVTDRCARLCQTALSGDVCGGALCQFAAGLPPGWGVCLSTPADGG